MAEFEARAHKLETATRDLEAMRPKPEPVVDPTVMASAIASLFAEFPFLSPRKQYVLARRAFVAFDVNNDGNAINAVTFRGETLA